MRKRQILFYTIISLLLFSNQSAEALNIIPLKTPSIFHDEVIATFTFEQYSSELLLLTATIDKKHFIHALKTESDCTAKDMMQVCGNRYLKENFEVKINDQEVTLNEESFSIKKNVVVVTYTIPLTKAKIEQVKVTSDYMFEFNNHSILKVIFDFSRKTRTFKIKNNRRTITAKFK